MKKLKMPTDEAGWEKLAGAIVKANLELAQWSYLDLERALTDMGLDHSQKLISAKFKRSRISAAFLLQCLVAIGVEEIQLPTREE